MKKEKMCLLGLLPALTVPMTLPCLAGNNAELPPNIIVVLTDDMGYGDIGIYGGKFIPTPNTVSYTHLDVYKRQKYNFEL